MTTTGRVSTPVRTKRSHVEPGFCPTCEVTLDLHDTTDGEDDFDCQLARRKADLLSSFGWWAR